jgi:hypothetical protein
MIRGVAIVVVGLVVGQADRRSDHLTTSGVPAAVPPDPRAVLKQALTDCESALAMKGRGPQARQLYCQALAGFEVLLRSGIRSGYLHYDVANTYLRMGDIGRAIVNYRRAVRLVPGDDRIHKNLQTARDLRQVQLSVPPTSVLIETLLFWHFGTSLDSRLRFAIGAYTVLWLLMFTRLLAWREAPALAWAIRAAAAIALVTWASVVWEAGVQRHRVEGVVVADEAVLRKGNGEYYEPRLDRPLSAGVEFEIVESRQDLQGASWYLVRLQDGKEGWLRADEADVI